MLLAKESLGFRLWLESFGLLVIGSNTLVRILKGLR